MELILKTIVNDFLFQAILERRQIEIWPKGRNSASDIFASYSGILIKVTYQILNYCLLFFRSWYVCMVSDCILDISVLDLHNIIWYIKFFEPSTIHFNKKIHAWWNELLTCRLLLCLCSAMVLYRCSLLQMLHSFIFTIVRVL